MAKVGDLTIEVSVESIFQKEICKVVEKIYKDHGLLIEDIRFDWNKCADGDAFVIKCNTSSSYNT